VQLDITSRNYDPSKRVRDTVEEKAQKFLKYADIDRVRYTLTEEHVEFVCEVHVHCMGKDFHASASSEDMLNSVDRASASLEKALRRYKTKRDDAKKAKFDKKGLTSAAVLEASLRSDAAVEEGEEI
jgi:ribosomal subunit interface protein